MAAFRRDAVDDAGRERLLGSEEAAGQCHLGREGGGAAEIEQGPVLGAAEAARGFGHLEFGARGGDDQVAFEHDAEREAHRIAVRRGDHGLPVDRPGQKVAGIGAQPCGPPCSRNSSRLRS